MLGNELLDEKVGGQEQTQADLTKQRQWWRMISRNFFIAFGLSFFILLFILYNFRPDDLQHILGDSNNVRYLAVGLLVFALISALAGAILFLRTLLLPFDYDLTQSECRSALSRSAVFFLILLFAFGIIPILLFYSISIEDFGDAIGVKPVHGGREFSFTSFVAACIWGGYFLILVLMQSVRALSYQQRTAKII
jgi:hypothetical protein